MFNLNSLIGQEDREAKKILNDNGYKDIKIILNSKQTTKCDSAIVCAVRKKGEIIELVCGEFYVDLKEQ